MSRASGLREQIQPHAPRSPGPGTICEPLALLPIRPARRVAAGAAEAQAGRRLRRGAAVAQPSLPSTRPARSTPRPARGSQAVCRRRPSALRPGAH